MSIWPIPALAPRDASNLLCLTVTVKTHPLNSKKETAMSLKGRINELANKHRKLDETIHEEQKRPSADALRLKRLKREKLHIKEELQMLKAS